MKTRRHFEAGDILTHDNKYYGLVVSAYHVSDSIHLLVLNTNCNVRQLNMMYSKSNDYSYKVINV